ncbi:hypothetical protein B0T10DRAFT_480379 [Thelonectria olida]|uniref:Nudix hydrolase domain-containing protein n=1 Tax=Thelonectria olida TaxID=1576542 RepID=A0A9P8WAU9_9HYPO|nr:hypothetical protein B0T10DRAFT_480379 [Thelonectria olida]
MATSRFPTKQYTSEQYVESCGAILFNLSAQQVCLIHYIPPQADVHGEWLLAKGRRNCGESRGEAALREVREETGYPCRLHPVKMSTRAPGSAETNDVPDEVRTFAGLTEPFMLTVRELGDGGDVKLIWWYIAVLDGLNGNEGVKGEDQFTARFLSYEEALRRLTYKNDRDVLQRAIDLIQAS